MSEESSFANLGTALNGYGVATWVWVVVLSLAGGLANFFRKLREGMTRPFNFVELIGEMFIAAFSGMSTFLFAEAAGFDPLLTAALVAISGHMGSRAVFLFEKIVTKKFGEAPMANPADDRKA